MIDRRPLLPIAEAERARRAAQYHTISAAAAAKEDAVWREITRFLDGDWPPQGVNWKDAARATELAAGHAKRAHLKSPDDLTISLRATALCRLARSIAIIAHTRGVPDAVENYDRAMSAQPKESIAA